MNIMRRTVIDSSLRLPLGRVALCLDCEMCFEMGTDACPACSSRMWVSVARFLDRTQPR